MTIYVGDTLTATAATVAGEPTPSRTWQWLRNGTAISGATSNIYTVQGADAGAALSVRQTETNFLGSASATSAETATVLFSPAALFESSEVGAWYDPSDLSTMWTDTGATTQASVGDAVARIDDKSGNGNHATQATFAARPILRQTGGGLYYLEFDGTDDILESSGYPAPGTSAFSTLAAFATVRNQGYTPLLQVGADATGELWQLAKEAGDTYNTRVAATNGNRVFTSNVLSGPVARLINAAVPASSSTNDVTMRENGSVLSELSVADVAFNINSGLEIGSDIGAKDFYGCVTIDRTLTTQEISDTEAYLATKSGVTL